MVSLMAKSRRSARTFPRLQPDLQIAFYYRLQEVSNAHLHEALGHTVQQLDISQIDSELAAYVRRKQLSRVASFGLRGEVLFPVPCVLSARPSLLGYYRLLYGVSQKEFYRHSALGPFKRLEERNLVPEQHEHRLGDLCKCLIRTGQALVDGIDDLSLQVVRDLQLLTLGPQLRGSRNTVLGKTATTEVFEMIERLVRSYVQKKTPQRLELENDSGRTVLVAFASDPDIAISEELPSAMRPLVSVEIKGGRDVSNIHNRIGEAEKSHQKARNRGFFEFWTIHGADVDVEMAERESPTTTQFFQLPALRNEDTDDFGRFREHLHSILGIRL